MSARIAAPTATRSPRWTALVLAVALGVAHTTEPPAGDYSCSFEHSWSECGFRLEARAADRVTLVKRSGVPAVQLRTERGDEDIAGSGSAERADLALSPDATDCAPGREQWWAHSLLFPEDYALPVRTASISWPWGVVFDFHHTGSRGQANFQIEIADDPPVLRFSISAGPVVSDGAPGSPTRRWPIGPVVRDRWYDFVYHVRWSAGGDGRFEAWVNGDHVLSYHGPTLYAGQRCYLKLANYHTPVGGPVPVLHARLARGPTRDALEALTAAFTPCPGRPHVPLAGAVASDARYRAPVARSVRATSPAPCTDTP